MTGLKKSVQTINTDDKMIKDPGVIMWKRVRISDTIAFGDYERMYDSGLYQRRSSTNRYQDIQY